MQHVFMSFRHEDLDFTENVISKLEKEGFSTWADFKIGAGEEWRTSIDLAIKNAFALIAVMTPEAKASEYVTYEWAFAWGVGIKVIPIMLRATTLHPRLEALQYLDFTNAKSRPWQRLIEEVRAASTAPLAYSVSIPLNSPPFIRQAVASLDSSVREYRKSAVETLELANTGAASTILIEALKHPLADVRAAVAKSLTSVHDPAAVPALIEALDDADESTRAEVIRTLGHLKDPAAVPALIKDFIDKGEGQALSALGMIGDPASVPLLMEVLKSKDVKIRSDSAKALGLIKDPVAVLALIEALKPETSTEGFYYLNSNAAEALGRIKDPVAVPALLDVLQSGNNWYAKVKAAEALGRIGDPVAVPALLEALKGGELTMRGTAAKALGEIGGLGAIPALVEARQDTLGNDGKSEDIRQDISEAIEAIRNTSSGKSNSAW